MKLGCGLLRVACQREGEWARCSKRWREKGESACKMMSKLRSLAGPVSAKKPLVSHKVGYFLSQGSAKMLGFDICQGRALSLSFAEYFLVNFQPAKMTSQPRRVLTEHLVRKTPILYYSVFMSFPVNKFNRFRPEVCQNYHLKKYCIYRT